MHPSWDQKRRAGALALCCALLLSTDARADDARELLHGYSMTTGVFVEGGATDYSAFRNKYAIAPRGVGVRYSERNGMITGTLGAVVMIFARAVGSSGNVKSVNTWEKDGYRYTETTYYTTLAGLPKLKVLKFVALCVGGVSCAEVDAFAAQHASAVPRSQWTTGLSACK